MAVHLLSERIRKYIRDKRWEQLRPIQAAAIERILTTENHYILASKTASGKTEAAFLPILSKVDFNERGVQVIYISPLIALINDQFYRVEDLCKNLEVSVTKWHGEANRTLKNKLIQKPNGIVLITPESLEAMFVNKPYNVKQLFSNVKFVVIDEIHSFIGTDRGIQLKSILFRLQGVNATPFRIIGLSATIGDYEEAKSFTGEKDRTKVLLDKTQNEIVALFKFFEGEAAALPLDLLKDLYLITTNKKVLVFPNSRGRAEEVAVKLKKISQRVNGHPNYFSHHSSVNKEVREYVEYFAKNNKRQNFCISCTSTLELGIDIGTVDAVSQIDATFSVASLIQRVGRSGRNEGARSNLFLYATGKWDLLQSLACWLLYQEGFIEPTMVNKKPYDILLHQALSITKSHSGIPLEELIRQLKENYSFELIEETEITEIVNYLVETDFLEKIRGEVIIGVTGEKIVNSREFYSVFKSEEDFKVVHQGNSIGKLQLTPQIQEDENVLLAAKIWKIAFIDYKAKKIEVNPARDGKNPLFLGSGGDIHPRIREKMFEILLSNIQYDFLDAKSMDEIEIMRRDFSIFKIQNPKNERPLLVAEKHLEFFTFNGSRINNTIQLLLKIADIKNTYKPKSSSFEIHLSKPELVAKSDLLAKVIPNIDSYLSLELEKNPSLLEFSKWGLFLPIKFQIPLLKMRRYDFVGTSEFLGGLTLV